MKDRTLEDRVKELEKTVKKLQEELNEHKRKGHGIWRC